MLATPTGVSAILINGKTIHSLFRLPRNSEQFKPLTGNQARELSNDFANVKFLILDEYSMIGCRMLEMINMRCKEATGNYDEDFGGLFTYLYGDIKQLPCVKDSPIYSNNQRSVMAKNGKRVINNIEHSIILNTCHRQQDSKFLRVLDNISEGQISEADYNYLTTRMINNLPLEEYNSFKDIIQLFSTKDEVKDFNTRKMSELRDVNSNAIIPVVKIEAKNNCNLAKQASTDEAHGLEQVIYMAKGCNIMLRSNLWLKKGLVNGAMGKVVDILYDKQKATSIAHPSVILCEFDSYTGPSIIPNTKIVPIPTILQTWTNKNGETLSRTQFPIALSYACSIHKSQGLTLNKVRKVNCSLIEIPTCNFTAQSNNICFQFQAVVNIGLKEFALGLTYVALSRVRCLESLCLHPFTFQRISNLQNDNMTLRNDFIHDLKSKSI